MANELTAAGLRRKEKQLHAMCERLEAIVADVHEALSYLSPPPPRPRLELVESEEKGASN